MIVGLSGRAGSGKDTVASLLYKHYGFERIAFADHLKKVAAELMGWPREWFYDRPTKDKPVEGWGELSPRIVAQKLGTEVGRNISPDIWVRRTMDKARFFRFVAIPDVRFPNEAEAIRKAGGYVVRIERPDVEAIAPHPSETALDGFAFDHTIWNTGGLEMLTDLVHDLARKIIRPYPDVIQTNSSGTSSWWYNQTE